MGNILSGLDTPARLRQLSTDELSSLAAEIRELMINTVAHTGGHLAPSLGAVELTLALYSIFRPPTDKIIWDVGHQAYAHKILTGRRDSFSTLRQWQGITGFPSRRESEYDAFGVGHASTSISAALGMAIARDLDGRGDNIIAVIGDGALTGGEAFEALNHVGDLGKRMIVILNDNGMSIDFNVGAMSEYLSRIRVNPEYKRAKEDLKELIRSIPHIGDAVFRTAEYIKEGVKSVVVPGGLFEEMGFKYIGPIDGHNIPLMREVFDRVRLIDSPVLVHVRTKKGKGYAPAEMEPDKFHGVGPFEAATGKIRVDSSAPRSYTSVFADALVRIAKDNAKVTAITAAMPAGTGLKKFAERFPDRFFDVGIAEEHAVTLAAGMAAAGMRPVAAIYSTFAQRAYDQLMHDVCLQSLPVTLCLDRAGIVGEDGPTHHGAFDLSYLRTMPNMIIFVPKDENELCNMLYTALRLDGPAAIRYPRGAGLGVEIDSSFSDIPIGKAETIEDDGEVALLAVGTMVKTALDVRRLLLDRGITSSVVNMRFVKPIDQDALRAAAREKLVVTLEENALIGGFGSAVAEFFADEGICTPLLRAGLQDRFMGHGARDIILRDAGLLPDEIAERIYDRMREMARWRKNGST